MSEPVSYLRAMKATGLKSGAVDRENKVIKGIAVNTLGEWLGHDMYGDDEFMDSLVAAGNALPNGLKSRYTHPGLCADGIGKHLGRVTNFRRDGDVVRGDLKLADAASKSPDGDLADYVMSLAEEDPESFGASIVLGRDKGLEKKFYDSNLDASGKFKTPDPRNKRNLPHARLSQLRACDVVGEPASNPGGFLSTGEELAALGETAFEFLTGKRDSVPPGTFGLISSERVKSFFDSFLQRHCLSLQPSKQEVVMPEKETVATPENKVATIAELRSAFPKHPDFVLSQLSAGATMAEAQSNFKDILLAEKDAEIAALKAQKPAPAPRKGPDPDAFEEEKLGNPDAAKDFMALSREYASEHKVSLGAAISACTQLHAAKHAEFVESQRAAKPRKVERPPVK